MGRIFVTKDAIVEVDSAPIHKNHLTPQIREKSWRIQEKGTRNLSGIIQGILPVQSRHGEVNLFFSGTPSSRAPGMKCRMS